MAVYFATMNKESQFREYLFLPPLVLIYANIFLFNAPCFRYSEGSHFMYAWISMGGYLLLLVSVIFSAANLILLLFDLRDPDYKSTAGLILTNAAPLLYITYLFVLVV